MLAKLRKHGFEVKKQIHSGKNSKLFSVVGKDSDDWAVKIVKDPIGSKTRFMFTELEILEKLTGNEVIVHLEQIVKDGEMQFLCFKYCKYGSLEEFATSGFARQCQEPTLRQLCQQLCEAIKIVHENNIIHGEIHPENILISKKYKNDDKILLFDIKLAGFTRSCFVNRASLITNMKKLSAQPMFHSPERMEEKYCQAGDVWAAGIVIFQLAWGYMPFKGDTIDELAMSILNTEFDPRKDSEEEGPWFSSNKHPIDVFGKQLIGNMLQQKVKDRYTANECFEHSWINNKTHQWGKLLTLFNNFKTTTKNLKLRFHIGNILQVYLPKRVIDMVKDFQYIYLNRKTDNGKIQTALEFVKIIEGLGGKMSTEQAEKHFNSFNVYGTGVGVDEIVSAITIDYMCKNEHTIIKFCDALIDKCSVLHLIKHAKKHSIKCDEEEITKEFIEVFSSESVHIDQFTVEIFGFHATDLRFVTGSEDGSSTSLVEFDFPGDDFQSMQSYNMVSGRNVAFDANVMCDDKIELVLEEQERKGKRTIFERTENSYSDSDEVDKNICQKICPCFF